MRVHAMQGDTVEAVCYRYYGYTTGITERVLEANPGTADLGAVLPMGHALDLPDVAPQPVATTLQLWD